MAELGTPENPEIIEPGQAPKEKAAFSKWTLARQIGRLLLGVTLPAIGLDLLFAYMAHTAIYYGGVLAYLGMFVLFVPAALMTLIAFAAHLVMWPALYMILRGRATAMPNFRVINVRRGV